LKFEIYLEFGFWSLEFIWNLKIEFWKLKSQ